MKYTLTFGRNSQLIWALIVPGFIGIIPLMVLLELSNKYSPDTDWILYVSVVIYLLFVVLFTFKWVNSVRADVEITFDKNQLQFRFIKKNIFHKKDFTLPISNLVNTSEDNDKGYDFLYIETKNTPYSGFHLMAKEDNDSFQEFKDLLYQAIDDYSQTVSEKEGIRHITIYQKWHMKMLAILFVVSWFIFPIAMYYQGTNWLLSIKYWVLVALSLPIVIKVYTQNFKK